MKDWTESRDGIFNIVFRRHRGRRFSLQPWMIRVFQALIRVLADELARAWDRTAPLVESPDVAMRAFGSGQRVALGHQLAALRMIDKRMTETWDNRDLLDGLQPDGHKMPPLPDGFQRTVSDELSRWEDDGGK